MIEIYLIYIIYILLYLFESIFMIPKNSVTFLFRRKNKSKISIPSDLFGTQNRSLSLSNFFFPYNIFSVFTIPQISINADSLFGYSSTSFKERQLQTSFKSYKFSEIDKIESRDNMLYINDEKFISYYSSTEADFWASSLNELLNTEDDSRDEKINALLDSQFDETALTETIEKIRTESKSLRFFNSIILFLLLANAVSVFVFDWFIDYFLYSMALLYSFTFISGVHYYLALEKLTTLKKRKRIFSTLKIIFYPPSAIGSFSEISTQLFSKFHLLPVLYHLCDDATFVEYVGKYYRDLLYPIEQSYASDDTSLQAIDESWRKRLIEKTEQFLTEKSVDINTLLMPSAYDNESAYYCPRCLTHYNNMLESCSDCYGVALKEINLKSTT